MKNKIFISLILLAGLMDLLTSLIGINYFGLKEVNTINVKYFFIGIPIWVTFNLIFIFFTQYSIERLNIKINNENINNKKIKDSIKSLEIYKYSIVIVSFIIPINNLLQILGVGLL